MSKVTKSSTKEEILKALDEVSEEQEILHMEVTTLNETIEGLETVAEKEQGVLHTEVTALNKTIEGLETVATERNDAVLKLETLVQEEDVKKKGLIKELASQSADIELARKKSEKYVEIKETLKSAKQELEAVEGKLFSANKKIELLTSELESFKNRALPSSGTKKGKFFRFFGKASTVVIVVIVAIVVTVAAVVMFNYYHNEDNYSINIARYDNGIIAMSHDSDMLTLVTKDGSNMVISGVDVTISRWAKEAGYDGILYGKIMVNDLDTIVLAGNDKYDYTTINVDKLAWKFKDLGCYNILALVDNPSNIVLPAPFRLTSEGDLKFYESRRKLAGFIPVFWGKDKRLFNITSDNITSFISTSGIFMDDGTTKAFVSFKDVEEDSPSDK